MTSGVLTITHTDHPVVSVLMVLYRGGSDALVALASVIAHTTVPFEVIVIDNGSPDGSGALVRISTTGATFVANKINIGFGPAMNQAAAMARGDVLCLLNPDVTVDAGWVSPLLDRLRTDRVAAVSPVLLNSDGSIQEAGASVDTDGWTHQSNDPEDLYAHRVDYASAACLLVRRQAFAAVGGFDPRYKFAYFEDVDLAFALAESGYETWLEPAVRVHHARGGTDVDGTSHHLAEQNHIRFVEKWAEQLARSTVA